MSLSGGSPEPRPRVTPRRRALYALHLIALAGCGVWFVLQPSLEPVVTALLIVAALLAI